MPQPIKHATALAAVPVVEAYVNELAAAGSPPDKVDALRLITDYARERAEQGVAKSEHDAGLDRNHALHVPERFRNHVYAVLEPGEDLTTVVVKSLEDFVNGTWTPPARPRLPRGHRPTMSAINVRVNQTLWDAVNALGKDPEQVAARGYKVTALGAAIAALEATFGLPEDDSTTA